MLCVKEIQPRRLRSAGGGNSFQSTCISMDFTTVLGIPVPNDVRALATTPPTCQPCDGDRLALELISTFGADHNIPKPRSDYERRLAYGLSDLVIILERPYVKDYSASFEYIVQNSNTLRALDNLIRFSSRGARSIYTVTVLNAFSMQPNKGDKNLVPAWHRTLAQIIQMKKPKVVLRCHNDSYEDEWMGRFEFYGSDYELQLHEVEIDVRNIAKVFQSFHPSCAVNNTDCRPELRALLIHHFLAAFAALRDSPVALPNYVDEIRQLCVIRGQRRQKPDLRRWQAAHFIEAALSGRRRYTGPETWESVEFFDTRVKMQQYRATKIVDMYRALVSFAKADCMPGTLAVAKVVTFFWEKYFFDEPLHQQVKLLLQIQGSAQPRWFGSRSLENQGAQLSRISDQFADIRLNEVPAEDCHREYPRRYIEGTLAAAKIYLRSSTMMELATSLCIASDVGYCEMMRKLPVDDKPDLLVLRSSSFRRLRQLSMAQRTGDADCLSHSAGSPH